MSVGDQAERSARRAAGSRPARLAARVGLAANGLIHLIVAWLAIRVAFGRGERVDQAGALQAIAAEPFTRPLLWLLVAAFAAVVLWRLREALWGFRYVDQPRQRTQKRLFSIVQAVLFTVLAVLATRVAVGSPAGTGGQSATAGLLRLPGGRPIVLMIGIGVLVTGAVMIYRGLRSTFAEDMDLSRATRVARACAMRTGQVGAVAKGIAVMIIGVLVGMAALTWQPARAEGLDAALKTLADQPFGPLLLIAVAIGLANFGVFAFFDAHYHRV